MTQEAKILGILGGITLLLVVGGAVLLGGNPNQNAPAQTADAAQLVVDYAPTRGSKDAKVTIVEFSDYQCPACQAAYEDVERVVNEYGDQIYFVYRQFPLQQHRHAKLASQAAFAAGKQNKYWEMHLKLFENQENWSELAAPADQFATFAQELGLNVDDFKRDMVSDEIVNQVQKELSAGMAVGVNSTPTFYINGQKYPGVLTYAQMKGMIDAELNN